MTHRIYRLVDGERSGEVQEREDFDEARDLARQLGGWSPEDGHVEGDWVGVKSWRQFRLPIKGGDGERQCIVVVPPEDGA
jgi:hypothetical protein